MLAHDFWFEGWDGKESAVKDVRSAYYSLISQEIFSVYDIKAGQNLMLHDGPLKSHWSHPYPRFVGPAGLYVCYIGSTPYIDLAQYKIVQFKDFVQENIALLSTEKAIGFRSKLTDLLDSLMNGEDPVLNNRRDRIRNMGTSGTDYPDKHRRQAENLVDAFEEAYAYLLDFSKQSRSLEKELYLRHLYRLEHLVLHHQRSESYRNSHRRLLPMTINNQIHDTVPDTGSIDNVVSEDFARSANAMLCPRTTRTKYHNACGKTFDSRWTTLLPCAFPGEENSERMCEFSVVTNLAVPLIMGSKFLEATETLTKFKNRLIRVTKKILTSWRLLHVQIPRRQLRCTIDKEAAFANADTGSNVDLVSLEYAQRRKWRIQAISDDIRDVELADGTIRHLVGRVQCHFSSGSVGRKNIPKKLFYVLPGLTSDVLLGDDTLEEIEAFERCEQEFEDVEVDFNPIDLIYWVGGEGWPSMKTLVEEAESGTSNDIESGIPTFAQRIKRTLGIGQRRKIWKATEILGHDPPYQKYLDLVANWNEREKDLFDRRVANLAGKARLDAEVEEQTRRKRYEDLRKTIRILHEQKKGAPQI